MWTFPPRSALRALAHRHLPSGHTLPSGEWERRHRGILVVLWALAPALPVYGIAGGHAVSHAMVGGASLLAIALLTSHLRARRTESSALASLGLCMASALAVHLSAGAIEAHFMFFVVIIIVSLYEDWRPFFVAVGFVVVHHGLMGMVDRASIYDHAGNAWKLAAIHGAFVLAASIASIVSWRLNEDVRAESRRASEQAEQSEARFRSAFEDGPVCMAVIGATGPTRGTLVRVNRTLCTKFGYTERELAGSHLLALLDTPSGARILGAVDALIAGTEKVVHEDVSLLDRPGQILDGRLSMSLVAGRDGVRDVIVQIEDVTERNRLERELQDRADLDPLTGLFNRRRFEGELSAQVERACHGGPGGAVVLIDLDNFKAVNDTLGHQAGDDVLIAAAGALGDRTRSTDIVARLGGDEFAVLVPGVTPERARVLGEALVQRVAERALHKAGEGTRRTTASVGVVAYGRGNEMSGDQLLSDADLAMYEAKDAGGNRCIVYAAQQTPDAGSAGRISWPDRIRRALDQNAFVLLAQPILDIRAGEITRYELLLRMVDSDGELILPGAFLPVAERRGTIRSIDRWVVREAISLLAKRTDDVRLHVNISARSLSDSDFLNFIRNEIHRAGADPADLIFELTETAAIANIEDARGFLTNLSMFGCGIAIDDFGSGFASFHYLKNLPFDELKIDGRFISNVTTNPEDLVLVETLVQLAGALGKRTIAEFVEDPATLKLIGGLGVDYAQGYHVGKPAPALAFTGVATEA